MGDAEKVIIAYISREKSKRFKGEEVFCLVCIAGNFA